MFKMLRIAAATLLFSSYFMPWVQDGLFGLVSYSPFRILTAKLASSEMSATGVVLLAIPILSVAAVLLHRSRMTGLLAGLVGLALTLFFYVRIQSEDTMGFTEPAAGLYLGIAASAILLLISIRKDQQAGAVSAGPPSVKQTVFRTMPTPPPLPVQANGSNPPAVSSAPPLSQVPSVEPAPCSSCGHPVQTTYKFCRGCGRPVR